MSAKPLYSTRKVGAARSAGRSEVGKLNLANPNEATLKVRSLIEPGEDGVSVATVPSLAGREAEVAREVAARREALGVADEGDERGCGEQADAGTVRSRSITTLEVAIDSSVLRRLGLDTSVGRNATGAARAPWMSALQTIHQEMERSALRANESLHTAGH